MPGDVNDPQRRNQQRHDGEERHFEKQRERNRQAQLYQTLNDGEIRFAEALCVMNIAHRTRAAHPEEHAEKHNPVNRCRRHAAADTAELRHTKVAVDKNVVHRNVDQQTDKSHYHTRLGFRQSFTLVASDLKEQIAGRAPQQRPQVADRLLCHRRVDVMH